MTLVYINLIVIDALILIPVAIILANVLYLKSQELRWKHHCRNCQYYVRIQHVTFDDFNKRGVVCNAEHLCDHVEDPFKCKNHILKPKTQSRNP